MSLLFNRKPIVINADLADRIGLNEAIVLQQLNYWISDSTAGEEYDGCKWVYNTFEEWQRDNFPFWSVDTVKRTFTKLKKLGLVKVKQLRASKHDHTNFYTIDYAHALLSDQGKLHQSNGAGCNNPSGQNATAHQGKTPQPNGAECTDLHTETTTETTTEISSGAGNPAPAAGEGGQKGGEGRGLPAVLPNQQQASQEEDSESHFQAKCRFTWQSYGEAYHNRYGTYPVRNAKVNGQIKNLVQRLGLEAPDVAEFYVSSVNDAYVLRNTHDLGSLLAKAESYRTQWATGRSMTTTRARQMDQTQANASAATDAIAMLRAKREREAANGSNG